MLQHLQTCAMRRLDTQTTFVLSMIIPFDDDDSDAVVRQDAQNSPPTFCCYSSAHYFTQRIWDIQNRRHIRAPQREEVTDDGTDHEVHFCERHCESAMPFDVDAMRGQPDDDDDQSALTSFFLSLSLSFSLSLSRAFCVNHKRRRLRSRGSRRQSHLFSLFPDY